MHICVRNMTREQTVDMQNKPAALEIYAQDAVGAC